MPRNGSGLFTLTSADNPQVSGQVISSSKINNTLSDIASALTASIAVDGQSTITANLPMATYRHTGVGNGVARTDYASLGQLQDNSASWAGTAGGTANAITLTLAPAETAYTAGQQFNFKALATNTGATAITVNALASKVAQVYGNALVGGEIIINQWYSALYDGTAFQIAPLTFNMPWVDVRAFGAKCDGTTDDSSAVQTAINSLNSSLGGEVLFPNGQCNLGTTGITTYSYIKLRGLIQPYTPTNIHGTVFLYSGTGNAVYGANLLNVVIENISIDATNATGSTVNGIYMKGAWLSTIRNVRVKGVSPAKGYGILIDTNAGLWGGQHNLLEKVEVADGIIRFSGTGGNDEVTTSVLNTIRGFQYQINNSQIVAINATAEQWITGPGWDLQGLSDVLLLHCDIEGNGTPGINIGGSAIVRELGTTWGGFTGTTKVTGSMAAFDMYGGGWFFRDIPTVGNLFNSALNWSNFAQFLARANNVTGGSQDGNIELKRFIAGTQMNQFEWRNQFKLEHFKSIANSATTVLTIPIPTNVGIRVKTSASGVETAAGAFSVSRETNAVNSGGTITKTDMTANTIAAGGSLPVITYTISGTNLLVQFNHGSATPSTINFIIEIDGAIISYTKG